MPDEIYGVMAVKNGQKQTIMNLSNARQKSYADLQTMTDAQKKGVIICPDYPTAEFLVTADEVSYGSGTVKDALDNLKGLTLVEETPSISENGQYTIHMTDIPVNKISEFIFMISFTGAFQYCSVHTFPKVSSTSVRMYHYINSSSVGTLQYFYNGSTDIQLVNQINESIKVRFYVRYV